ncbi:MAG: POTRA domain-containing protein [Terriglobia bacterium]|jgi:outer membrane protein assembly factor BamA|nr:POTRA domain-containing protein [Terriglobia bacterium]
MPKSVNLLFLGIALLSMASTAVSQQSPAKTFVLQQIVFKGSRVYQDSQLLAASGMKIGGSYSQQDLQDSASKLSSTGMFKQVVYRFSATSAEYDLVDNPAVFPVRFDNCVWMSDEQMLTKLKERLPLFNGVVPEEGTLAEDVEKQMEAILGENGLVAKVMFVPLMGRGTMTAMNYTVLQPRIEVAAVDFSGASPDVSDALEKAVSKYTGKDYTRDFISSIVENGLEPVLLEKGYLRSSFGQTNVKLLTKPGDPVAKVELSVPVEPGVQYRIASLTMKGNDAIAKDSAKQLAQFKTGQVINMMEFRSELSKLGGAYLAKGYMNAKVKAEPTFDDTAHTVSYDVELVPGEQYKLTKLDIEGLDEKRRAKLEPIWMLKVGDPYDASYAPSFLRKNASKLGFLNGYSLAWKQKVNDDTKSVELDIFFRPPGSVTH